MPARLCVSRYSSTIFAKAIAVLGLSVTFVVPVGAQTTWTNPGEGSWFDPLNWSEGLPTATVDASIKNGGTSRIESSPAEVDVFEISGNSQLEIANGGTFAATTMTVVGGSNVIASGLGTHVTTGLLSIATNGQPGVISILEGASGSSRGIVVGYSSTPGGNFIVDGFGTQWVNEIGTIVIGGGAGQLKVTGGATLLSSSDMEMGNSGAGRLSIEGAGSQVTVRDLKVGTFSAGQIVVADGGKLTSQSSIVGKPFFPFVPITSRVTVTGAGSQWIVDDELDLGYFRGELAIADGGYVENNLASLSTYYDGIATVTVTGADSTWKNGEMHIGKWGPSTITVSDGGQVYSNMASLGFWREGHGTVVVDGTESAWIESGELAIGRRGRGEMTVSGGASVTAAIAFIGGQETVHGTLEVTGMGSTFVVQNDSLAVAREGIGELFIRDGGQVTSQGGFVALTGGSEATIVVNGAESRWDAGPLLTVGYFGGKADISIKEGGVISAAQVIFGTRGTVVVGEGGTLAGTVSLGLGGTLHNDGLLNGDIVVTGGSHLSGSGVFGGAVTVGNGGVFSPGGSPGLATTSETFWNANGQYLWEINATAQSGGQEGMELGWDLWETGNLSINGAFKILLSSLAPSNDEGPLVGWNPAQSQEWRIATAENAAFSSLANLTLDTSGFMGDLAGGEFSLATSADGRSLFVRFTAVPEASTFLFAGVGGLLIWLARRSQRATVPRL